MRVEECSLRFQRCISSAGTWGKVKKASEPAKRRGRQIASEITRPRRYVVQLKTFNLLSFNQVLQRWANASYGTPGGALFHA
jgi:hypothetical protein